MTPSTKVRAQAWTRILCFVALAILLHACIASKGWWNPIVERHGFRQTQTAITAFWLSRGSPILAYETPVFGPPWSIPFEFPLYQWLVSVWSRFTSVPIDQSGRLISLLFFYAGLAPVGWMVLRLRLPLSVFVIFAVLYLGSPLDLYWPRTFLIETTAMAFSLAYFCAAVVCLYRPFRWDRCAAAVAFGTLAALVKITTFAGALVPVCLFCLYLWVRRRPGVKGILYCLAPISIPLTTGVIWARFADAVKIRNPLQAQTSGELLQWNFGTLSLRLSKGFWAVLDQRMMRDLLGAGWPIIMLATVAVAIIRYRSGRTRLAYLAGIGFCVGPLVFANLYYIHDYYPCGTAAYLYLAVAIIWGSRNLAKDLYSAVACGLLFMFLTGSAFIYHKRLYPSLNFTRYAFFDTGRFLKSVLGPDEVILIYGAHWDSTIAYYAEHRAVMDLMYRSTQSAPVSEALQGFKPGQHIGAVVGCNEALDGWYRDRVLASAAATGMLPKPAYEDDTCRVYLPAADQRDGPTAGTALESTDFDTSWLWMPSLGGSPLVSQSKNPLLEGRVVPLSPDPVRLAPIEGPGGRAAILANPDTQLGLPVPDRTAQVILGYGIKDYAWRVRSLPGVTFQVYVMEGDRRHVLWERSLNPGARSGDRGVQEAVVKLPPGTFQVILATTSPDKSMSNRAYWSSIDFRYN